MLKEFKLKMKQVKQLMKEGATLIEAMEVVFKK